MKVILTDNQEVNQFIILQSLKEEAHKQLSYYRQKQDDLVARMATEWPSWGCSLDLYTHMILPLLRNPFILNFINLSEGFDLSDVELKFGHFVAGDLKFIVEKFLMKSGSGDGSSVVCSSADLVDFALHLLTGVTDVGVRYESGHVSVSGRLSEWSVEYENRSPLLVRLRDADIGAQAFFALLEGIMRNSSKHGLSDNQTGAKKFRVKVVFCDEWKELERLVECDGPAPEASDHGFILVSVNRDLLDEPDGSGERKIGGQPLVSFLRERFDEGIIDRNLSINPGNWGIKEMKTCAAFLSGKSLLSVNDQGQGFILIGSTRGTDIWEDGRRRLCYVLRIERPRVVLALVPEEARPNGWERWRGARFVSDEVELFKENADYDFLYVDENIWATAEPLIRSRRHELPQRVVHGEILSREDELKAKPASEMELAYRLYDHVLSQYMENLGQNELAVRIYFEDNVQAAVWRKRVESIWHLEGGRTISVHFLEITDPSKFRLRFDGYQVGIFRHKRLGDLGLVKKTRASVVPFARSHSFRPYYVQHASGADSFFSFFLSINPEQEADLANIVIRQFVESALLNVLIVDERIALSLAEMKVKDEPEISLAEKLYWMGIHVAGSVRIEGQSEPIWATKHKTERLLDVVIGTDGSIKTKIGDLPIHILMIHATRLNGIIEQLKDMGMDIEKQSLVEQFRQDVDCVIVHSGRGKTEGDIPKKTAFLEYSTVEKYILNEPSKFYLVQIARSVKGEKQ